MVADADATLRRFRVWEPAIHGLGLPVALVLQDGITAERVPWDRIEAVFVGGSTHWKLSPIVIELLEEAGRRGMWRHVGRVNTLRRIHHFWQHAENFDGNKFNRWSRVHLPRALVEMSALERQPLLMEVTCST